MRRCRWTAGCACSTASRSNWASGASARTRSSARTSTQALALLKRLQMMMDSRYAYLLDCERRKIAAGGRVPAVRGRDRRDRLLLGHHRGQEAAGGLRRAAAGPGRPGPGGRHHRRSPRPNGRRSDIIPTSSAGSVRVAVRRPVHHRLVSSDIVLGHGWAQQGWSANTISPNNPGAGLLIAEGGSPQLVKVAYLDDRTCAAIAAYAADPARHRHRRRPARSAVGPDRGLTRAPKPPGTLRAEHPPTRSEGADSMTRRLPATRPPQPRVIHYVDAGHAGRAGRYPCTRPNSPPGSAQQHVSCTCAGRPGRPSIAARDRKLAPVLARLRRGHRPRRAGRTRGPRRG